MEVGSLGSGWVELGCYGRAPWSSQPAQEETTQKAEEGCATCLSLLPGSWCDLCPRKALPLPASIGCQKNELTQILDH